METLNKNWFGITLLLGYSDMIVSFIASEK